MTDTGRSGGKILKFRRTTTRTTPYDRPQPPPPPPPPQDNNPNWLTGLVSPAKFVAGGATKILSSFWNPKTWASSSSSSEDEEDETDSEDESGDEDAVNDLNQQQQQQQQQGSLSQKSQTLHLIEQLLMLEQFSREEGDRLIEIIKSRVLDYSVTEGGDAGPSTIRNITYDETPDIRSQAIREAKKWVAENKVKPVSKSNLDNGFHALKSAVTPQATEGDAGSPIDVAKSYMRARPPWASPISHDNSPTPSPLATDLFKERTPYSGGGTSFSPAKKDYLLAGSWNIQEEIRRVRTKATEDMLSSHRSMKHAPSTSEYNTTKFSLLNDKYVVVGKDEAINFGTPKPVTEIVTLDSDEGTPGLSDMRDAQDDREQYQGLEKEDIVQHDQEKNKKVNDLVEKNCYLMTESQDIPPINFSQGSSNNDDHSLATKIDDTSENRAVTRAGRNTRRGRGRGK